MKRCIGTLLSLGLLLGFAGCAEKSSTTIEKTIKTPDGTSKTTEKIEVKKTGDNPP